MTNKIASHHNTPSPYLRILQLALVVLKVSMSCLCLLFQWLCRWSYIRLQCFRVQFWRCSLWWVTAFFLSLFIFKLLHKIYYTPALQHSEKRVFHLLMFYFVTLSYSYFDVVVTDFHSDIHVSLCRFPSNTDLYSLQYLLCADDLCPACSGRWVGIS